MACRSLEIATRGRISCHSRTRMTMGLLCCDKTSIVPTPPVKKGGGSSKGTPYKTMYKENLDEITWERLLREDEELLIFIKAFLRCR